MFNFPVLLGILAMLRFLHPAKLMPALLLISLCATQAFAEETKKDGSLDAMWKDKDISTAKDSSKEPKSIDTDTEFKIVTPDTQGISESDLKRDDKKVEKKESQPAILFKSLCPYEQLKESPFIKQGTWPGVGPFDNLNNLKSEFKDKFDNKLDLIFEGENVAKAKLKLVNRSQKPSDLLSIEMTADFLLEALGAKSVRIAKFNSDFEEQQNKLKEQNKLTLNAGKLEVFIAREGEKDSSSDISISVKHTEKAEEKKKEPEKKIEPEKKPAPEEKKTASDNKPVETPTNNKSTSLLDQPIVYKAPKPGPLLANNPKSVQTSKPAGSQDNLKEEFTKLLTEWQGIKKAVYKNRQNSSLLKLLGGAALTKQSKAIKWLLDNHRYYEVTPKGLSIESYKAITPNRKYNVVAKISERRQYVDANTMHILKDINSAYKASYTIEKIRGSWIIIDSKLVK